MTDSAKFDNIEYLATGNTIQQEVYALLVKLGIMQTLQTFQPLLVGTIPIDIAVEGSDLDIICCYDDAGLFEKLLADNFGTQTAFQSIKTVINGQETVLATFIVDDWLFEIFGQSIPTKLQNGYRHMITEYKLLEQYDESFRQQIILLKQSGLKTEPAFAKVLGINGDPYAALLNIY